ncbi:helix-turn-helix domain-containing protein [Leptolyngbya sp. AN02str]|uniref:helix-turn-helix domain-containing protein n=1 Tax=Leptolyngbya sp. AN02str TaxID=3423363 RepID=UPI003D323B15
MTDSMSKGISQLEQLQVEQLQQIGAYLFQVREDMGLSLEQIATKTMISGRLLNAIETGNLKQLPEPVYIRGFIKRYAEALGLSGEEISQAFPVNPEVRPVPSSWKETPAAQLRYFHLWLGYAAVVTAAVIGLSYLFNRSTSGPPTITTAPTTPASAQASPNALPSVASSPSPSASPSPISTDPVRVSLRLLEESWIRITVDGRTDFEGILQEGTERSWTAKEEINIRAGNAGGVSVIYNEQPAQTLGERGLPRTVTFTANSSNQSALLP